MTPILATALAAAELISRPQIEIIDPPNKLRQEIKTKNNPGTRHGNEFGATLTLAVTLQMILPNYHPLLCLDQIVLLVDQWVVLL
jgi:hypothetical protein